MRSSLTAAGALCLFNALSVSAIDTISAVGSKFFTSSGDQFYIKGVAYQLSEDDPLLDSTQCQLDASLMAELGANTIRVYHVDETADHTDCMKIFADAGIYLFVDLDDFKTAINGEEPSWTQTMASAFEATMDEFQQYDNTIGFLVGNEVLTTVNDSIAAPYVLAAARDMKAYRDKKGYREIPVGYAAADIATLRPMLQNYFACQTDSADRMDFFALNAYEWCGDSSYTVSGYDQLNAAVQEYNIPIFFSETGCNTVQPRDFSDQAAILGSDMDGTWSGAIIYEWIQEVNDYGIVSYPDTASAADGVGRSGTPTPVSPDFSNLMSQWATLSPTGVALSDYSATASTITPIACPASTSGGWAIDPSAALPTLGQVYDAASTGTAASSGSSASGTASGSAASSTSSSTSGASTIFSSMSWTSASIWTTVSILTSVSMGSSTISYTPVFSEPAFSPIITSWITPSMTAVLTVPDPTSTSDVGVVTSSTTVLTSSNSMISSTSTSDPLFSAPENTSTSETTVTGSATDPMVSIPEDTGTLVPTAVSSYTDPLVSIPEVSATLVPIVTTSVTDPLVSIPETATDPPFPIPEGMSTVASTTGGTMSIPEVITILPPFSSPTSTSHSTTPTSSVEPPLSVTSSSSSLQISTTATNTISDVSSSVLGPATATHTKASFAIRNLLRIPGISDIGRGGSNVPPGMMWNLGGLVVIAGATCLIGVWIL